MQEADGTVAVAGTALVVLPGGAVASDMSGAVRGPGDAGQPPVVPGRSARTQWTAAQRATFLDHFALSGDVPSAAMMIGMDALDAYALRRRDARFAAAWRVALDVGYDRLEASLIRQLLGRSRSQVNVGAAMLLLEQYRASRPVAGGKGAAGKGGKSDLRARAERELLRRLKAYGKRTGTTEPA